MTLFFIFSIAPTYSQHTKSSGRSKKEGQEIKIPMEPAYWTYDTARTEFVSFKTQKA